MMHEEAHLTLKEKKKKKDDEEGWEDGSCAPAYETFVFTVKRPIRKRDI